VKCRMEADTKKLDQTFVLREPAIRLAIRRLQFLPNSYGLDISCGIGNITGLLAESIAPRGRVSGVDISPDMVAYSRNAAEKASLTNQLSFRLGDMEDLPFDYDTFDWVWSMDCVGYAPIEPLPIIEELVRMTKPRGRIALLSWSS